MELNRRSLLGALAAALIAPLLPRPKPKIEPGGYSVGPTYELWPDPCRAVYHVLEVTDGGRIYSFSMGACGSDYAPGDRFSINLPITPPASSARAS